MTGAVVTLISFVAFFLLSPSWMSVRVAVRPQVA